MTGSGGRRNGSAPVRFISGRRAAASAIVLLLAGTAAILLDRVPALSIEDGAGRILARLALPGGRFAHHFIHSVHLRPVDEYFELRAGRLHLYELRYDTQSVGMPSDAEGGFRLEGGRFVLSMDREFKKIPIRVSIVAGHGVVVDGALRPFTEWAAMEDLVVLSASSLPRILSRR